MKDLFDIIMIVLLLSLTVMLCIWLFGVNPKVGRRGVLIADSALIVLSIMVLVIGMLIRNRHIASVISGKKEELQNYVLEKYMDTEKHDEDTDILIDTKPIYR